MILVVLTSYSHDENVASAQWQAYSKKVVNHDEKLKHILYYYTRIE